MTFKFVRPDPNVVTVVERISDAPDPNYLRYAKTRCVKCDQWCWLGDKSAEVVSQGQAMPMCQPCAADLLPPNAIAFDILQNTTRKDLR